MSQDINYVLFLLQYFPIYQSLPHDLPKNGITEEFSDLLQILDKQMREQNYSSALVSCTKVYHTLRKLGVRVPHTAYAKLTFQLHTVSLGLYAAWNHNKDHSTWIPPQAKIIKFTSLKLDKTFNAKKSENKMVTAQMEASQDDQKR